VSRVVAGFNATLTLVDPNGREFKLSTELQEPVYDGSVDAAVQSVLSQVHEASVTVDTGSVVDCHNSESEG
jgi:hypothetical protein